MMSSVSQAQDELPVLEGPYIGQKPPGLTPEVFDPGLVSTEYRDWGGSFTPDMKEYYFSRLNIKSGKTSTFVFKSENNRWHESAAEPGGGFISPDGKTRHDGNRYRERTDDGWSELKSLGSPFEDILIMRLTASSKGTYFFDKIIEDGKGGYDDAPISSSRLVDGKYEEPKPLSKEINTGKNNSHPFIAPDESYIIWDSQRDGGFGDSDIYISYRQQDGSWGEAINMGDKINTEAWEAAATVTPDGKYLFFNRNAGSDKYENVDIFWVDAQIIEDLRSN